MPSDLKNIAITVVFHVFLWSEGILVLTVQQVPFPVDFRVLHQPETIPKTLCEKAETLIRGGSKRTAGILLDTGADRAFPNTPIRSHFIASIITDESNISLSVISNTYTGR